MRARHRRKGIGLTFPNPDAEIGRSPLKAAVGRGNASELGDGGSGPGKSSLFFVRIADSLEWACTEIGTLRPQSTAALAVSGAPASPRENPREAQ